MDWDDYNVDVAVNEKKAVPYVASLFNTTRHSTGSVILNALFKGGLPAGKIVELVGVPGIGKTTTALHICRTYCESGNTVVYIDIDQKVNDNLLESMELSRFFKDGPDKSFFLWKATSIKDCYYIMDTISKDRGKSPVLIVIDSPIMMSSETNFVNRTSQASCDVNKATILKKFLLKYRVRLRQVSCSMILINHLEKVNTETLSDSLIYGPFTDARIVIRKESKLSKFGSDKVDRSYGVKVIIYAVKNHFGYSSISFPAYIIYGEGLSNTMSYRDYLIRYKVITYLRGCYTFKAPDFHFVCSGEVEINKIINEYFAYVQQIVAETGGFILKNE